MIARAHLHSMRMSVRKVRIVLDLIRGKYVEEAFGILAFTRKAASETVLKLLRSAVTNAQAKGDHPLATLYVSRTFADGGFAFKKTEPKAMLRHGVIKKRTCHVTIEVDEKPVHVAKYKSTRPKTEQAPVAVAAAAEGKA
jgi:large subunit ribosomal protein L22